MSSKFKNFVRYQDLFIELIRKDIRIKYRNSVLGIFWSMLNPLLMMIVLTVIFSNVFQQHIEHFPVYVLTGRLIYQFFSESTNFAMDSINNNGQLIRKVYVPKYLFPISRICSSFITTFISLIPLALVMAVTGVGFHWTNILVIIPLVCLLITSIGVGLLLSTITVFFRDIKHLYSIVLTVVMYMTPIFYPISIIPVQYKIIFELNPLFGIVDIFRSVVIQGEVPMIWTVTITIIYSLIIFGVGFLMFYKKQDKFIYYL
ncbi:ABC transporter permease [Paenibacillus sp. Y412MC10]|uniref:ABC transporter permease n=1 Tax=Geobacillus sp. (strain Y412MC10) TaxID=481743 RepID=UPI0011A0CAAF|nr:ABC transporter permease [Paenibacillus sp. Y412MC10]